MERNEPLKYRVAADRRTGSPSLIPVTYSVTKDANGGYAVLVTEPGSKDGYIAITFQMRQRAIKWIETRRDLDKRRPVPDGEYA